MSFWHYVVHGPWLPVLLAAAAGLLARRETRDWLRAKPTDWNAVRESLGYEAQPDRPVRPLPEPYRERLLGFWPLATDWDAERRRLGYGRTVDGSYRVISDRPPQGGSMS